MTFRKLAPEEEAIFDLIIHQREKNEQGDDYLIYSLSRGQKELQSNGMAVKYGIGLGEQLQIIQKLAKDGIIDADWITQQSNPKKSQFQFAHHKGSEMWDKYGSKLMLFNGKDCMDSCFIKIGFSRIKAINDICRAKHRCSLQYDATKARFYVKCDNGKKYVIKKLKCDMPPFEILRIALENPRQIITREDLKNSGNKKAYVGKKSIATQVYDDNSVVRNELVPFVKLTNDSIYVEPEAELTLAEIKNLEKVCF